MIATSGTKRVGKFILQIVWMILVIFSLFWILAVIGLFINGEADTYFTRVLSLPEGEAITSTGILLNSKFWLVIIMTFPALFFYLPYWIYHSLKDGK